MEWYEIEVRELEKRLKQISDTKPSVCFYGSSSIRLWETLERDFPNVPILNCGFGGSTLEACSWFFWRLIRPLRLRSLILYAGDNDLGDGRAPAKVIEQLEHLCQQLDMSHPNLPLGFISIKPSPARWPIRKRIEQVNAGACELLAQRPHNYFINVYPVMLGRNGLPRPELYCEDGLHMSLAGYRVWVEALRPYSQVLHLKSRNQDSQP